MAAQTLCLWNKFGYCRYSERCRNYHVNDICQKSSCETFTCRQRHPNPCKFYINYKRCKFSPCAFKHEEVTIREDSKDLEEDIKVISDKMNDLETIINEKDSQIQEMSNKISCLENKLAEQLTANHVNESNENESKIKSLQARIEALILKPLLIKKIPKFKKCQTKFPV